MEFMLTCPIPMTHNNDRLMDKFVKRELDFHFSRTNCARYLYILTAHVLWPGGVWDETEEKRSEAAKEKTRAEVLYVAGFFFF